jgi:outer membrane protein assembly factor BamE (lipoprotein component of BamABCDE complex)
MDVTQVTAMFGRSMALALAGVVALGLAACSGTQLNPVTGVNIQPIEFRRVQQRGFVLQEGALEQISVGSSRNQVEFVLGTPTTVATIDGDVFYYISQTVERIPALAPTVIDQRVIAVYFDRQDRVTRVANYGMQDGRVFDFVSRTTPTGGRETTFLQQIFQNLTR